MQIHLLGGTTKQSVVTYAGVIKPATYFHIFAVIIYFTN